METVAYLTVTGIMTSLPLTEFILKSPWLLAEVGSDGVCAAVSRLLSPLKKTHRASTQNGSRK